MLFTFYILRFKNRTHFYLGIFNQQNRIAKYQEYPLPAWWKIAPIQKVVILCHLAVFPCFLSLCTYGRSKIKLYSFYTIQLQCYRVFPCYRVVCLWLDEKQPFGHFCCTISILPCIAIGFYVHPFGHFFYTIQCYRVFPSVFFVSD